MQSEKTILVTGANGQLGQEMRRLGAVSPHRYLFTDIAELDITDPEAVRRCVAENSVQVIVNCAAYTQVDRAEEEEARARLLNRDAVAHLAAAAREHDAVLIHISTDYVFGGTGNTPRTEEMPVAPLGVYGRTKLEGEEAIAASGCRHLIFRTAWLYSEFGSNFLKTMLRLTAERPQVQVVFDQVSTPTYAGDLALALFSIIEAGREREHQGIYHFSDEGVCSWYDFALEIARAAGRTACEVLPCHSSEYPSKVVRPAYSVLDKSKVKRDFGIDIPHWRDSMCYCLQRIARTASSENNV